MARDTGRDLEREKARFEVSGNCLDTWLRHCPRALDEAPMLRALERYLFDTETSRLLEQHEREGTYPEEAVAGLRALGLCDLLAGSVAEAPPASVYHLASVNVITARAGASVAITAGVNFLALLPAYLGATRDQLGEILGLVREGAFSALALTELEAGSDLGGTRSFAERGTLAGNGEFVPSRDGVGGSHYRLHGEKQLINGGTRHELMIVLMRTEPGAEGSRVPARTLSRSSHSLFWLRRQPGVVPMRRWETLPARAADISGVRFDGLVLDSAHRIGAEGEGIRLVRDALSISRGGVSALAVGTLARARELTLSYAGARVLYGKPIAALGAIAEQVLHLDVRERVAVAVSLRAVAWVNAAGPGAALYTAVAKLMSCKLAEEGVSDGLQVLGARGLLSELPYERLLRDVVLYGIFDGTSHLMLEELQMHLSTEERRWNRGAEPADTLVTLREIYATPPRPLPALGQQGEGIRPVPLVNHAGNLARVPGSVPLGPLADAAEALLRLVAATKVRGIWGADQGLRFELAESYATLEAACALVELFDPDRRRALVDDYSTSVPGDAAGYRLALGWLGNRICVQIATRAMKSGLDPRWPGARLLDLGGLPAIQGRFLSGYDRIRRARAQELLGAAAGQWSGGAGVA